MLSKKNSIIIILFLQVSVIFCQITMQKIPIPYGGAFRDIKMNKNGWLFTSVDGGFYKSTDYGYSWQSESPLIFNNQSTGDITIANSGKIYVNTGSKIVSLDSAGADWNTEFYYNGNLQINSKNEMYLTLYLQGLLFSGDSGKTWRSIGLEGKLVRDFTVINDTCLYVIDYNGLYISNNAGKDWEYILVDSSRNFYLEKITKDLNNNLFIGTMNDLFISTNRGNTWEKINYPELIIDCIYVSDDNILYIGCYNGLYSSADQGKTWHSLNLDDKSILCIYKDKLGALYAGTFTKLYRLKKGNSNWEELIDGISNARIDNLFKDDKNIYMNSISGLFKSPDAGFTWEKLNFPKWTGYLLQINEKGRIFGISGSNLIYSKDYGNSWDSIPFNSDYGYAEKLLVSDNIIYLATSDHGIYINRNFEKQWSFVWGGSANSAFGTMQIDDNKNLVFNYGNNIYKYYPDQNKVKLFYSLNSPAKEIINAPWGINYILSYGKIYKQLEDSSWKEIESNIPSYYLASRFTSNNEIYLFDYNAIYYSNDLGMSFKLLQYYPERITPMCFLFLNDQEFFLGTQESGLYKVNLSSKSNLIPSFSFLQQNFPNPFNNETRINFFINRQESVSIKIYNISGQDIETVTNDILPMGYYSIKWNPQNLASGVYFYRIKTNDFTETKKLILLK